MNQAELLEKLALIPEDEPDELDRAMLQAAAAENDGQTVSLEEARELTDYSGRLNIRIPKSLHRSLSLAAKADGVSLNQYILYKLAQ